jgi:tetratricopeptide (TPR) repeat protein
MSKDALSREVQRVLSIGMSYADVSTKLDPKNYRNWVSLGNVYQFFATLKVEGSVDRAREAYGKAKALSPNDRTLDILFANLAETAGDSVGAKAIIEQSIKDMPTIDAYVWLYQRDVAAKNYSPAESHLVNAIAIDNTNTGLLTELGTLYFVQGKYADAIPAFERSLFFDRNQLITFGYLGVAYEAAGRTDQANQVFDFLRKQIPNDAENLISKVRAQKGGVVTPTIDTSSETNSGGTTENPTVKPKQ